MEELTAVLSARVVLGNGNEAMVLVHLEARSPDGMTRRIDLLCGAELAERLENQIASRLGRALAAGDVLRERRLDVVNTGATDPFAERENVQFDGSPFPHPPSEATDPSAHPTGDLDPVTRNAEDPDPVSRFAAPGVPLHRTASDRYRLEDHAALVQGYVRVGNRLAENHPSNASQAYENARESIGDLERALATTIDELAPDGPERDA